MSDPVDTPIGAVFDSSHIATLIAGVLGTGVSPSLLQLPERSVTVAVDESAPDGTPASLDDTCGDDTALVEARVSRGLSGAGRPVDVAERLMLWDERRALRLEEARRSAEAERLKREDISASSPVSARELQECRECRNHARPSELQKHALRSSHLAVLPTSATPAAPHPQQPSTLHNQLLEQQLVEQASSPLPLEARLSEWELRRQTKVWAAQLEAQAREDAECTWVPRISDHARSSSGRLPVDIKAALRGAPGVPQLPDRSSDPHVLRQREAADLQAFLARQAAARKEAERVRRVREAGTGRPGHYSGQKTVPSQPVFATDARLRAAKASPSAGRSPTAATAALGAAAALSPGAPERRARGAGTAAGESSASGRRDSKMLAGAVKATPTQSPAAFAPGERRRTALTTAVPPAFGTSAPRTVLAGPGVPMAAPAPPPVASSRSAGGRSSSPRPSARTIQSPDGATRMTGSACSPSANFVAGGSPDLEPSPDAFPLPAVSAAVMAVESPPISGGTAASDVPLGPPVSLVAGLDPLTPRVTAIRPVGRDGFPTSDEPGSPPVPAAPAVPFEPPVNESVALGNDDIFAVATVPAVQVVSSPTTASATPRAVAANTAVAIDDAEAASLQAAAQGLSAVLRLRASGLIAPSPPHRPPPPPPSSMAPASIVRPVTAVSHLVDAAMLKISRVEGGREGRRGLPMEPWSGGDSTSLLHGDPVWPGGGGLVDSAASRVAFLAAAAAPSPVRVQAVPSGAAVVTPPPPITDASEAPTQLGLMHPLSASAAGGPGGLSRELDALHAALEAEQRREDALLSALRASASGDVNVHISTSLDAQPADPSRGLIK